MKLAVLKWEVTPFQTRGGGRKSKWIFIHKNELAPFDGCSLRDLHEVQPRDGEEVPHRFPFTRTHPGKHVTREYII